MHSLLHITVASPSPPGATAGWPTWPPYTLAARVGEALDAARIAVVGDRLAPDEPRAIALLLHVVLRLDAERHPALVAGARDLARVFAPVVRAAALAAELQWQPATARDRALPHLVLTAAGFTDAGFDAVLARALAAPTSGSGEQLPHDRLAHAWLAALAGTAPAEALDTMADRTALASVIDVCRAPREDLQAVADALGWVTDLGGRAPRLARSASAVLAEIEGALAGALDEGDVALVTALLAAWPQLGAAWSATASFAFAWVVAQEATRRESLALACALGGVSAMALATVDRPLADWPDDPVRGTLLHMLRGRLEGDALPPSWVAAFDQLPAERQRGLATLLADVALRRAVRGRDLVGAAELLVALEACGGRGTAASAQVADLLHRLGTMPRLAQPPQAGGGRRTA